MKQCIRVLLIVSVMCLIPLSASADPAQGELLIGLIPEMNVFKQMERFRPLSEYLSEKTGVKVNLTILSRYGNIIDSFVTKKMDAAFFGSFTGAMAIQKLGLIPIARPVNLDGESTYHGHFYTRKDSGIKNVEDMNGKRMAFVERATTAGFIFPLAVLKENGVKDLDTFFKEYFFAGSHDASLKAVLNKEADVGASKNTVYDWVRENDPRVDKEIVILYNSAPVPSNGLLVRKGLNDEIVKKLKNELLNLDTTPQGKRVLETLRAIKFIETSADDYAPVFDLANKAGIDIKQYQYKNE